MLRHSHFLALLLLLSPVAALAREAPDLVSPSFVTEPELSAGFDLLYQQKFAEAREIFSQCIEAVDTMPKHRRAYVRQWKGLAKKELVTAAARS